MCLIAVALDVTSDFPLVIAANRDEDYERPSLRAHVWADAPHVIGGRDVTHGGSWLAISTSGRFAAVTNLRGAKTEGRSRGLLVSDFVREEVERPATSPGVQPEYAGFNLVTGTIGSPAFLTSSADGTAEWTAGVHGVSNAPPGVPWPKVTHAIAQLRHLLDARRTREELVDELLRFLSTRGNGAGVESDVFVVGDRYGTRSSTVVIASRNEVLFVEQTFGRGGNPDGDRVELRA